jgi:hypothetical protein
MKTSGVDLLTSRGIMLGLLSRIRGAAFAARLSWIRKRGLSNALSGLVVMLFSQEVVGTSGVDLSHGCR